MTYNAPITTAVIGTGPTAQARLALHCADHRLSCLGLWAADFAPPADIAPLDCLDFCIPAGDVIAWLKTHAVVCSQVLLPAAPACSVKQAEYLISLCKQRRAACRFKTPLLYHPVVARVLEIVTSGCAGSVCELRITAPATPDADAAGLSAWLDVALQLLPLPTGAIEVARLESGAGELATYATPANARCHCELRNDTADTQITVTATCGVVQLDFPGVIRTDARSVPSAVQLTGTDGHCRCYPADAAIPGQLQLHHLLHRNPASLPQPALVSQTRPATPAAQPFPGDAKAWRAVLNRLHTGVL